MCLTIVILSSMCLTIVILSSMCLTIVILSSMCLTIVQTLKNSLLPSPFLQKAKSVKNSIHKQNTQDLVAHCNAYELLLNKVYIN